MITLAEKTKRMIDMCIESDQGSSYRQALQGWFGTVEDIYRPSTDKSHRTHLGCSVIGGNCDRAIWYSYRWTKDQKHDAKLIRLFNSGNIFEAKFCAMLEIIGCEVMQYDKETGKQFSVSAVNGLFGGSGDGIALHIPDVPEGELCLLEMKSHGDKSFKELVKKGVRAAKPVHVTQMQMYMELMGIKYGMYLAGSKNTDEIHLEIIEHDTYVAKHFLERAERIIYTTEPPPKVADSAAASECRYCDFANLCHRYDDSETDFNCRQCLYSYPSRDKDKAGRWQCSKFNNAVLPTDKYLYGCAVFERRQLW